jgi:hypothetical protein
LIISISFGLIVVIFYDDAMNNAVKASDLKWLPNGSEFLESESSNSSSSSKPKTYTSFTCLQDSLPEFSDNPIGFKGKLGDTIIAKLGPGQVTSPLPLFSFWVFFWPLLIKFGYMLFLNNVYISITIYLDSLMFCKCKLKLYKLQKLTSIIDWKKPNWRLIRTMYT